MGLVNLLILVRVQVTIQQVVSFLLRLALFERLPLRLLRSVLGGLAILKLLVQVRQVFDHLITEVVDVSLLLALGQLLALTLFERPVVLRVVLTDP